MTLHSWVSQLLQRFQESTSGTPGASNGQLFGTENRAAGIGGSLVAQKRAKVKGQAMPSSIGVLGQFEHVPV